MQGKLKLCVCGGGGGQVAFVFRLSAGQVEISGLFLTLERNSTRTETLCRMRHRHVWGWR